MRRFLRRAFGWIVLPPIAVVASLFAIANRTPTTVTLDPLPVTLNLPLYAFVFAAIFFGLLIGYLVTWWAGRSKRRDARRLRRELAKAEAEILNLRAEIAIPTVLAAQTPVHAKIARR